jgi:hypothetical protein
VGGEREELDPLPWASYQLLGHPSLGVEVRDGGCNEVVERPGRRPLVRCSPAELGEVPGILDGVFWTNSVS